MADEKLVKVKMLRQVGPHAAGSEVEIPAEQAEELCKPSMQQVGHGTQNMQKAVKVEDFEKLKKDGNVDISMMTQVEMNQQGLVNRIASPYDTHHPEVALENTKKLEGMDEVKKVDQKPAEVDTKDVKIKKK